MDIDHHIRGYMPPKDIKPRIHGAYANLIHEPTAEE